MIEYLVIGEYWGRGIPSPNPIHRILEREGIMTNHSKTSIHNLMEKASQ